ncbi:MAG: VWA domain-containing protein [bacterium]|nr:VWA domain-containing protein [bacterium]
MFLDLFYGLRDEGVPVGLQEWKMLMDAIAQGLHGSDLLRFYNLARACLIKSETYYDAFDRVFARVYKGVEGELSIEDEVLEWLRDPKNFKELTDEQREMLEHLTSDELMRRFLETLAEQDERHDGGGKWVGTGGRSPYGHGGEHPTGIRVGGESRNRSAMKIAEDRKFQDYRTDSTLDLRSTKLALKRLRQLTRVGPEDELDLDESIEETCKNAGEIELVFRPERRNNVRLLLLMDVGGTMDPYYEPMSRLLTALYEERGLREFRSYYFHNCIYEQVCTNASLLLRDSIPTGDLFRRYDERWKVVIVGDAAMHPSELLSRRGNINPRLESDTPGIDWLRRIDNHFLRKVWLNPDPRSTWQSSRTCRVVEDVFPMYPLSVDGIAAAVKSLVGARQAAA